MVGTRLSLARAQETPADFFPDRLEAVKQDCKRLGPRRGRKVGWVEAARHGRSAVRMVGTRLSLARVQETPADFFPDRLEAVKEDCKRLDPRKRRGELGGMVKTHLSLAWAQETPADFLPDRLEAVKEDCKRLDPRKRRGELGGMEVEKVGADDAGRWSHSTARGAFLQRTQSSEAEQGLPLRSVLAGQVGPRNVQEERQMVETVVRSLKGARAKETPPKFPPTRSTVRTLASALEWSRLEATRAARWKKTAGGRQVQRSMLGLVGRSVPS